MVPEFTAGGGQHTELKSAGMLVERGRELDDLRSALQAHRLVALVGPPGSGKSTLARQLAASGDSDFSAGIDIIESRALTSHLARGRAELLPGLAPARSEARSLVIVDGVDELPRNLVADLLERVQRLPGQVRVLVTSREPLAAGEFQVSLGSFSEDTALRLLAAYGVTGRDARRLVRATHRHPASTALAGALIGGGRFTPPELLSQLHDFRIAGIVSPSGAPVGTRDKPSLELRLEVVAINEELLRALDKDIALARQLSPRRFEELVADLMARKGYAVELTPASKDGGKDIYVARRDDLGTFLYLVECKRYALENPVGVEVVRALYGTVQAERATAGVLVTTSVFTSPAREFQRNVQQQLSLRDYVELHRWVGQALRAGGAM